MITKRILFCATVDFHFRAFHLPYLKWLKEQGWEVHIAASGKLDLPYVDKKYDIPIQRSPLHKANLSAYKQLKEIIHKNQYKIIHCHTPMGGVLTRLAAKRVRKNGTKVIYTAHGFHFCKGVPFTNWLIYYPIEKVLSNYTDTLITINKEDYKLALNHHFKAKNIEHVHGVGVNIEKFHPVNAIQKNQLRKQYGYKDDEFLMFYAAEFNKNKNQQLLIRSLELVKAQVPNVKLLLAGEGPLLRECQELTAQLGLDKMIDFLGYRNDIDSLLKMCDCAVGSSIREGLPVNIMEAMACGLPVVATDNRGHRELVLDQKNGWVIANQNVLEFAGRLVSLAQNRELGVELGLNSRNIILATYGVQQVLGEKSTIYLNYMNEMEGVLWTAH
ncbi:glycosyltransferase family 4 protein [Neobacillus sp. PS3-12]|uniref:glycosyltransferase family 4 protein n=1 Tax=Neobacillus sp. PS3-12 TaxID=3070677 RepID=UPI0027E20613|nr:glycosyltransferase family 4 protein [Neobacillus sp. PS3-12]WML51585.1 glycosyltransferase family 4 protein [Neobacillus sp. PS3-12]